MRLGRRARADLRPPRPRRPRLAGKAIAVRTRSARGSRSCSRSRPTRRSGRARHRARLDARQGLRDVPAQRAAAGVRLVGGVRAAGRARGHEATRSRTTRTSGGTCAHIRASARSSAHLRRPDAARQRRGDRRARPEPRRHARRGFRPGEHTPVQPITLIAENKWRAARDGLDAKLIDLEHDTERPARGGVLALVERAARRRRSSAARRELDVVERLSRAGAEPTSSCASTRRRAACSPSHSGSPSRPLAVCDERIPKRRPRASLSRGSPIGDFSHANHAQARQPARPTATATGRSPPAPTPLTRSTAPGAAQRPAAARREGVLWIIVVLRSRRARSPAARGSSSTRASRRSGRALEGRRASPGATRRSRSPISRPSRSSSATTSARTESTRAAARAPTRSC